MDMERIVNAVAVQLKRKAENGWGRDHREWQADARDLITEAIVKLVFSEDEVPAGMDYEYGLDHTNAGMSLLDDEDDPFEDEEHLRQTKESYPHAQMVRRLVTQWEVFE